MAPQICGIYFFLLGEDVVYIGRSLNILQRLKSHRFSPMLRSGIFTVGYVPMPLEESIFLEREWVLMMQPVLNEQLKKETR